MSLLNSLLALAVAVFTLDNPALQEDTTSLWRLSIRESVVSAYERPSAMNSSDQISRLEMSRFSGVADALRNLSGVQIKDYGGVGGLKTVNIRSLGSEYTGVFIDGLQVDNAQNMQVDLGRFSLENLAYIDLYSGGRSSAMQTAREFSSASSIYMTSLRPSFDNGQKVRTSVNLKAGSFGHVSPSIKTEHLLGKGLSLRMDSEVTRYDGRYDFKKKEYIPYPDGTVGGFDTLMTRYNNDLKSFRLESQLFSPQGGISTWDVKAYLYGSDRGLPGPVIRRLSQTTADRQTDLDAFVQGRYRVGVGRSEMSSLLLSGKLAYNNLHYWTNPDVDPHAMPFDNTFRQSSAYGSASFRSIVAEGLSVGAASDVQYSYLDADLRGFVYPGRISLWEALYMNLYPGSHIKLDASIVYNYVSDHYGNGSSANAGGFQKKARTWDALTPSVSFVWRITDELFSSAFVKRTSRMPSFNDLYYTLVGNSSLDPETAWQTDASIQWQRSSGSGWNILSRAELYYNHVTGKIIATPTSSQFRWSMYNIGNVHILGSELKLRLEKTFSPDVSISVLGRYSFQDARDFSDPDGYIYRNQIPYVSKHSGSVSSILTVGDWVASLNYTLAGKRWSTGANVDDYLIRPWECCDITLTKDFRFASGRVLGLRLDINNISSETYELVQGYPMPLVNVMTGIRYSF